MDLRLDDQTAVTVGFAARMMGVKPAEVIARLVREWAAGDSVRGPETAEPGEGTAVFCRYRAKRVDGILHSGGSLTITTGKCAGETFNSPSGAGAAVVRSLNPERLTVHVNGWRFWKQTATGRPIDFLRD